QDVGPGDLAPQTLQHQRQGAFGGDGRVGYYVDNTDTTMMWMDEANCCYLLSGREIPEYVYEEAIQLMIGN
ncbi:MAG: hypothetical protein IIV75_04630, partial [Lachnospiraceae bacterium]|nr:hypothetical protein [Lachnospiraceae bacterium]